MKVQQVSIQPVGLHRLLVHQDVRSIDIGRDRATLTTASGPVLIPLASASLASSTQWLVLRKITLTSPRGTFDLSGIPPSAVTAIDAAIQEARRRALLRESLSKCADETNQALAAWDALAARDAYLSSTDARKWREEVGQAPLPGDEDADLLDDLPDEQQRPLRRLLALRRDPDKVTECRNDLYAGQQLHDFRQYFDTVEGNPLTDQQRRAIVHDEDNALVIAGAGTGKTSTVVGKVGYLLRKGWAAPDEILLLAFTSKAADEMRERIERKLGADVKVRTFHALGLEIIAQAQGKKPSLCAEAEDPKLKAQTLMGLITDLLPDDTFRQDLLAFRSSPRRAYKPAWEFKSQGEYTQYLLDVEPRALNGRLLRSYEECEIANWLVTHGVPFEYERPYEVDTATIDHRQYRPDFYLPEQGIYVEHWGVDRGGNAAPFMDPVRYREKMEWARALHARNGTRLVETYSWQRQGGVLLASLDARLRENGVDVNPISAEAALGVLKEKGRIDPFADLVGTFLSLFKSAGYSVEALLPRAAGGSDAARAGRFLRLFGRVSSAYESLLRGRGEIDFDDMITLARGHVADGTYQSRFRYVLVDEFQDISAGRARLIQALRDQVDGAKLFCVGDDWQSIYRFTGSDISLTTEFEKHFGPARGTALDRTFRFHDRIAEFSSRFVQKNPSQLRKRLSTAATSDQPGVVVCMRGDGSDPLPTILAEIAAHGPSSVFVLARYGFTLPDSMAALKRRYPSLDLRSLTAHGSKGLEADYVVVLGLDGGKYGFPSEIADDPALGMVLADGEAFEHAEERRLFYVAVTRARKRVYLVADAASPSAFVREVMADGGYEKVLRGDATSGSDVCPACERGKIARREGEFGVFYSCSNYPICTYRATLCSECGRGRMRHGDKAEAQCDACGSTARVCPKCHLGVLTKRRNKRDGTYFRGCSSYGRGAESCDYTERMGRRGG